MLICAIILLITKCNMDKVESVFQRKWFRYLLRVLILYFFSVVFKSFDLTFPHDMSAFLFRGQAFSALFILFGLLAWEGAILLCNWLQRRTRTRSLSFRSLVLIVGLIVYGLIVAYGFSFSYAVFDILLFQQYGAWKSFRGWSYDLIMGIFFFYMLIVAVNAIAFYYRNWKESQVNAERLMRENLQARYDVLRNQIDPHFFFNSLSVLTNLVYKDPDLAAEYITQLAKCYRYILDKKFENLVSIETELSFLESYTFLIRIRHQQSIGFMIDIADEIQQSGMVPPASLQMLVENAVKHNRFSANLPLLISIKDEGNYLVVTNNLRKRSMVHPSTGVGLDNISKRYELTSDKRIEVLETSEQFIVKIPIITLHENYHIRG